MGIESTGNEGPSVLRKAEQKGCALLSADRLRWCSSGGQKRAAQEPGVRRTMGRRRRFSSADMAAPLAWGNKRGDDRRMGD